MADPLDSPDPPSSPDSLGSLDPPDSPDSLGSPGSLPPPDSPDSRPASPPSALPDSHDEPQLGGGPSALPGDGKAAGGDDGASDGGVEDGASVKTTTASIFPEDDNGEGEGAFPGADRKQHKLGLDINAPWGWDGSMYNDYE